MKSLILKDFYNISHNAKSMFLILLVFAVAFLPTSGVQGYIFTCAILCSMMIVTTFSFDEHSNWPLYAMVMPVSKKDIVAGKYFVLFAFSLIGIIFGLVVGTAGNVIAESFSRPPGGNCIYLPAPFGAVGLVIFYGFREHFHPSCYPVRNRKRKDSCPCLLPYPRRHLLRCLPSPDSFGH